MGKRELVALLSLPSWCLVIVVWLFLAVPWVCLQFVIVVFLGHLLFFQYDKGLVGTKVPVSCTLKFMRSMIMKQILFARPYFFFFCFLEFVR